MSQNVKFISFDKVSVGKHVKATKKKFTWKFELNEREHQVDLYYSRVSGRRKVLLNGDIRYESDELGGIGVSYPFRFERSIIMVVQTADYDFDLRIDNFSLELLARKQRSEQVPKNPFEQTSNSTTAASGVYNRPATTRHSDYRSTRSNWSTSAVTDTERSFDDSWKTRPKPHINLSVRSDLTQLSTKPPTEVKQISLINAREKLQPVRALPNVSNFVDLLDLGEEDRSIPSHHPHIQNTGKSHSESLVVKSKPAYINKAATPHQKHNPFVFDDRNSFETPATSNARCLIYPTSDLLPTVSASKNPQTYETSNVQNSMYAASNPFSSIPVSNTQQEIIQNKDTSGLNQMCYPASSSQVFNLLFPYTSMTPAQGNTVMVPNPMTMDQYMANMRMGQMLNNTYYPGQPK